MTTHINDVSFNLMLEDSKQLAIKIGAELVKHPDLSQTAAMAMVMGSMALRDVEAERFPSAEEALAHYTAGALALYADLINHQKKAMQ